MRQKKIILLLLLLQQHKSENMGKDGFSTKYPLKRKSLHLNRNQKQNDQKIPDEILISSFLSSSKKKKKSSLNPLRSLVTSLKTTNQNRLININEKNL